MDIVEEHNSELVETYGELRQRLLAYGRRCGVGDEDIADALQDCYLRLHNKPIESRSEAHGKFIVAFKHLLIDTIRSRRRRFTTTAVDNLCVADTDYVAFKEAVEWERHVMESYLTRQQATILKLRIHHGMEYSEIAGRLGINEGAVRTAVCRSRKILKEKLKDDRR